jgi:hypothetical protein
VEDCSIAGYEEEEYGDTRLPYGVQRTRTPDSLVSRYRAVVCHSTAKGGDILACGGRGGEPHSDDGTLVLSYSIIPVLLRPCLSGCGPDN